MRGKCFLAQSVPEVGQEPVLPVPLEPVKKSRKKLFVLIGVVAVAAVLLGSVLLLSVPQGLGETIPYGYGYTVGQKLTYSISITESAAGQQASATGYMSMHIVSFDGENYTIDEAVHSEAQGVSQDYNFTLITNKAGHLVGSSNLPSSIESTYSMLQSWPGYGVLFNRTSIRVGETVHVPVNIGNSTLAFVGTFNYKVDNVENVTVPAGTYKAFKLEVSTSDFHGLSQGIDMSASISGNMIIEYGTCHALGFDLHETVTGEGVTVNLSISMTLTEDTLT